MMGYLYDSDYMGYMSEVAYNCTDKELESMTDIELAFLLVYCRDELLYLRERQNPSSDEYDPIDDPATFASCVSRVEDARDRCERVVGRRFDGCERARSLKSHPVDDFNEDAWIRNILSK